MYLKSKMSNPQLKVKLPIDVCGRSLCTNLCFDSCLNTCTSCTGTCSTTCGGTCNDTCVGWIGPTAL